MRITPLLLLLCLCALNQSCVSYMEHQAANSQTGDPNAGGYFGYNQGMADTRLANLQSQRDSARQEAAGTAREASLLRSQYSAIQRELNSAKNNAARDALVNETSKIRKQMIMIGETL